ncbi:MAG: GreA/GreB family elongation factor [Pseudomonadota bacterium]
MARWRPPAPKSAPYITEPGYKKLELESAILWDKRIKVAIILAAAAAECFSSENAEYIYRKKQLREIDARIGYLQRRMPKLKIVKEVQDERRVYFGAWVTLEDETGNEKKYRIVGADEFDQHEDYITIDAPLSRLILGKSIDDEIHLVKKNEEQFLIITKIEYDF